MQEHAQLHYLASEAEEIKAVWEWEGVGTLGGGGIFSTLLHFHRNCFQKQLHTENNIV